LTLRGKIKNDYIKFTILFDYRPTEEFSVAVGPEIGVLIKNQVKYDQSVNGSTKSNPKNVQQFDAGLKAKVKYIFAEHYLASVEYYWGMTKIYKYTQVNRQIQEPPKIYNSNLGISLGYVF